MPNSKKTGSAVQFRSNSDIAIHVPNLQKAEAFYGETLGFPVTSRADGQLAFDTGSFTLWVNKDSQPRSFIPSFNVSDYPAAVALLEAAGSNAVETQGVTYFLDPFGFAFDIVQKR
jgi:catechol 2,3-dioxygenase-like lactoylglutathione lyase family enzyme